MSIRIQNDERLAEIEKYADEVCAEWQVKLNQ